MHSSSPPSSWPWRLPTPAATAPLSSPPSLPGSLRRRALPYSRAFWWVDSAQLQRTPRCARLAFLDSGLGLLPSSGQATGTLDAIVEFLSGDFCASMGDDRCPEFVDVVIRQGLPMIYAASDDVAVTETCNAAVEGTCPAKLRLF